MGTGRQVGAGKMNGMHLAPIATLLLQTAATHAKPHGPWHAISGWLQHFSLLVSNTFKPFGIWGLAGLSLLDSALIPLPGGLIGWVVFYVAADHLNFFLCAFVTALASTLGSLLPYYVGRVGGEQFLLKKINRQRFEKMRDRFERQEFLAIMLPAMSPPPIPLKLFEFCAGVFEMRVRSFLLALFTGKFIQFLIVALFAIRYGTAASTMLQTAYRTHARVVLAAVGLLVFVLLIWVVRKVFDRRRGIALPIEEAAGEKRIVEE